MSISDSCHRQGRVPCASHGSVRRPISLISLGEEFLCHGFVLKLGFLEHGREGDEHSEKVFRFCVDGVFAVEDEEFLEVLIEPLTELYDLLDSFLICFREFLLEGRTWETAK